MGGRGWTGWSGVKGGKWDNCNSIINKYILKKEIENLFENIMNENFPNLAKGLDFQEVQEAQRVPKKLDPRKQTPRHIIITLPEVKNKEGILKAAIEKEIVTYKGVPMRLAADFSKEILQARRG